MLPRYIIECCLTYASSIYTCRVARYSKFACPALLSCERCCCPTINHQTWHPITFSPCFYSAEVVVGIQTINIAASKTLNRIQSFFCRRQPLLLDLPPSIVAARLVQLKTMLPKADVAAIVIQKPSILLIRDIPGVLGGALQKLKALMPGIPVEDKLHHFGNAWWSFVSLIP